jgi:hypothetical protein
MHIVFDSAVEELRQRFLVLELDTFRDRRSHLTRTAWCVIENIPLEEMPITEELRQAHEDLMRDYRTRQWQKCLVTLSGLTGRWAGEVDSFYEILAQRIQGLEHQELPETWDGAVEV